ncbi:hypothetical protein [uncultured Agrobacterium sp.]|nr:hypothetical protein [uncultured Agrobacterium sp.]
MQPITIRKLAGGAEGSFALFALEPGSADFPIARRKAVLRTTF